MISGSVSRFSLALAIVCLAGSVPVVAQEGLSGLPEASQAAGASQTIGVTEMVISYHRPGVKGRDIWGRLVPYGEVWRAGANENTVISFSHAVKIEGQDLAAGRYGLHMIPTSDSWTVAFSRNATSWGSFFYRPEEDALRVTVTPEPAPAQEWLQYTFDDPSPTSVVLALRWEKLRIPIRVEVDTKGQSLALVRDQLRTLAGFGWRGRYEAAAWCLRNDTNLEEAMAWIDRSLTIDRRAGSLVVKAGLLEKQGKTAEAQALLDEVTKSGDEAEINNLGYTYLGQGNVDKALQIFELNLKGHPGSWNAHDSLAETYAQKGDREKAIQHYEQALELAPEAQKARITAVLSGLRAK